MKGAQISTCKVMRQSGGSWIRRRPMMVISLYIQTCSNKLHSVHNYLENSETTKSTT